MMMMMLINDDGVIEYDDVDDGDKNICNFGEGGDEEDVKLENLVKTQVGVSFTFFLRNSSVSVGWHFHFLEN